MKKGFFGYSVSEVDVAIDALREENESLNSTITSLKTHIKNIESGYSAKSNLLEADIKEIEEALKQSSDKKENLEAEVLLLSSESETLRQKNETLNSQLSELDKQIIELTSHINSQSAAALEDLQTQLDTELDYKTAMEKALTDKNKELGDVKDELATVKYDFTQARLQVESLMLDIKSETQKLNALTGDNENMKEEITNIKESLISATRELEIAKISMDQKSQAIENAKEELEILKAQLAKATTIESEAISKLSEKDTELENSQKQIQQLQDELAASKAALDKQAWKQAREKRQLADLNSASEISTQAYHDMGQMRSEVIEYLHIQMKDYYQLINDNSTKMRAVIEQCQTDYNRMLHEFFSKLSAFRLNLTNIDSEYNNMNDYGINIDKISSRMNEIMENFINESNSSLKKNEKLLMNENDHDVYDKSLNEESEKKSLNIQEFRTKRFDKQGYV